MAKRLINLSLCNLAHPSHIPFIASYTNITEFVLLPSTGVTSDSFQGFLLMRFLFLGLGSMLSVHLVCIVKGNIFTKLNSFCAKWKSMGVRSHPMSGGTSDSGCISLGLRIWALLSTSQLFIHFLSEVTSCHKVIKYHTPHVWSIYTFHMKEESFTVMEIAFLLLSLLKRMV